MKKTYQMPAVRWMEAQTEQMIAVSVIEDGFNQTSAPPTEATSGNLSRQFTVWGDDEEE
jgi:hypothetical protein